MRSVSTNVKEGKKNKVKKTNKRPFWVPLIISWVILAISGMLITYNFIVADVNNEKVKGDIIIKENERELFVIKNGDTTTSIAEKLKERGLVGNVNIFKILSKLEGFDGTYKTGTHYLKKGLELRDIMKILASPTETIKITFPEGYTISKIANKLYDEYKRKLGDSYDICTPEKFLKAVNNLYKDDKDFFQKYPLLEGMDFSGRDNALEGYLFPDTYLFDLSASPEEIIGVMINNFSNRYLASYTTKAASLGLTLDEVIKLASIVEKEARLGSEGRRIAGVFYNRINSTNSSLNRLQSCATLQYIIERQTGSVKEVLKWSDTQIEGTYNTYLHEGLPPGPICNPGEKSIKAVLNLEKHDYYFFVQDSRNELGSHLFSKTNSEHENNKKLVNSEV